MIKLEKSILEQIEKKEIVLVAIDGPSGSGKTTFARMLAEKYDANIFHMDDFFLRPEQRTRERYEEAGGNIDYERFHEEVLRNITKGFPFHYRPYSCSLGKLLDKREVAFKRLNIIEGVYSLHPLLMPYYDIKVFMTAPKEACLERIRERSGSILLQRFINEWIPMEERYFNHIQIEDKCDFRINGITLEEF
ncbi:MAG: AAA family ATPase [Clostridiaceae bacterium]|nr:AAA family ATPase [Clostridiaceae bacterium]